MHEINITGDELVSALLNLASRETVGILDSCGVGHLGSHLLIAGIKPVEVLEISNDDPNATLSILDEKLSGEFAAVFTISYDFGLKLLGIDCKSPRVSKGVTPDIANNALVYTLASACEPDIFLARFDALIIHDYDTGKTNIVGDSNKFDTISRKIERNISNLRSEISNKQTSITSNFTKDEYLAAIETIKERIRRGETYQTNLTQQLAAKLPDGLTPEIIFQRLRRDHPAPFAAFIKRRDSTVISASPERFFRVSSTRVSSPHVSKGSSQTITTSPIKGTRPRGQTPAEDAQLRQDLLHSPKDRAENTMIVDLLRNDLGRVCEYGSVGVEKLCDLEEHPTLFHLGSTISGDLRPDAKLSDILRAVFPCGSITGAPKISTMRIINGIETADRGLSMGAIGYYVPGYDRSLDFGLWTLDSIYDLSVAIRTMVIRDQTATFNVGGGIVIDSDPESEYEETLVKAKALLAAVNGQF